MFLLSHTVLLVLWCTHAEKTDVVKMLFNACLMFLTCSFLFHVHTCIHLHTVHSVAFSVFVYLFIVDKWGKNVFLCKKPNYIFKDEVRD